MAVLRGPQVLFALTGAPPELTRREAGSIQVEAAKNDTWKYTHDGRTIPLRPFWRINDEVYQTYWKISA